MAACCENPVSDTSTEETSDILQRWKLDAGHLYNLNGCEWLSQKINHVQKIGTRFLLNTLSFSTSGSPGLLFILVIHLKVFYAVIYSEEKGKVWNKRKKKRKSRPAETS